MLNAELLEKLEALRATPTFILYEAKNVHNGKRYFGYANGKKGLNGRRNEHLGGVRGNSELVFHRAIRKYGEEAFIWRVIAVGPYSYIKDLEIRSIAQWKTFDGEFGYNMTKGGDGTIGYKHRQDTKDRISAIHKGRKQKPEHIEKLRFLLKGRVMPPEEREKHKGKGCWNKGMEMPENFNAAVVEGLRKRKEEKGPIILSEEGVNRIIQQKKNSIWIHKGTEKRQHPKDEPIPEGFERGMGKLAQRKVPAWNKGLPCQRERGSDGRFLPSSKEE
jgi:hypothetical protein